jgi:hypothetical protein
MSEYHIEDRGGIDATIVCPSNVKQIWSPSFEKHFWSHAPNKIPLFGVE